MRILAAIVLGGLAAGVLDIVYAFVVYGPLSYGLEPRQVLQSVAAGWMGGETEHAGGWNTAFIGLATHFMIATIMAAVYVLAASRIRFLTERSIFCGLVYGLILYVAMNYVAVPLSAAGENGHFVESIAEAQVRLAGAFSEIKPNDPNHPWLLWGTIFTHTVLVGLPIAVIAKRFA